MHSSIDEGILRSILQNASEFLVQTSEINDVALQRISNIIVRHLNHSTSVTINRANGSTSNTSKHQQKLHNSLQQQITYEDILNSLYSFDRRSHDKFLEALENYVSSLFISSLNSTITSHNASLIDNHVRQPISPAPFERRTDCSFLDLTPRPIAVVPHIATTKSNELLSALRKKDDSGGAMHHGADIVAVIVPQPQVQKRLDTPQSIPVHILPLNNNQDLAEADQICSNDDDSAVGGVLENDNVYFTEDDFIKTADGIGCADSMGAVGGLVASQLPDLANVTQTPSRITSFEDESVTLANAEVERINSQSFEIESTTSTTDNANAMNDSKQKNH